MVEIPNILSEKPALNEKVNSTSHPFSDPFSTKEMMWHGQSVLNSIHVVVDFDFCHAFRLKITCIWKYLSTEVHEEQL